MADNGLQQESVRTIRNIFILISILIIGILTAWGISTGLTLAEKSKEADPQPDSATAKMLQEQLNIDTSKDTQGHVNGSVTQMVQDQLNSINKRTEIPDPNSNNPGGE